MKIKNVEIKRFRNLENVSFDLKQTNIFSGKNGIGKTTIIDSILWCLCGETIVYGKQDSDNRNSHNLRDIVNVILTIEFNGVETTLERKYYDNWVVDKDGNEKFSEVKNLYFVNGSKYKKDEYYDYIKGLINVPKYISIPKDYNLLRSLIDYNYYSSIDYKIARKFTENILKLKSDSEIIEEERFKDIKIDMQILNYDFAKCINKYDNERKEKEVLVADKTTLLNNYKSQYDIDKVNELAKLEEERNKEIAKNIENETEFKGIFESLEQTRLIIQETKENQKNTNFEMTNKLNELIKTGYNIDNEIKSLQSDLKVLEYKSETAIVDRKRLESQKEDLQKATFKEILCPHCGGVVNQNEKDNFEKHQNEEKGKIEEKLDSLINEYNNYQRKIYEINKKIRELTEEKAKVGSTYYELKAKETDIDKSFEEQTIKPLEERAEELNKKLEELKNEFNVKKIATISELTSKIDEYSNIRTLPNKIESLEEEIKQLKQAIFSCEIKKDLVKEFKETKLKLIKESTHTVFPQLDFEIMEVNVNTGAMKEVCYAKLKDVEYKGINDGHRKLVGIIIIEDIKKALGIDDLPIIFDKRADVDNDMLETIKKTTNAQIITTEVSDNETIINKGE